MFNNDVLKYTGHSPMFQGSTGEYKLETKKNIIIGDGLINVTVIVTHHEDYKIMLHPMEVVPDIIFESIIGDGLSINEMSKLVNVFHKYHIDLYGIIKSGAGVKSDDAPDLGSMYDEIYKIINLVH